jgi:hypothetical protein
MVSKRRWKGGTMIARAGLLLALFGGFGIAAISSSFTPPTEGRQFFGDVRVSTVQFQDYHLVLARISEGAAGRQVDDGRADAFVYLQVRGKAPSGIAFEVNDVAVNVNDGIATFVGTSEAGPLRMVFGLDEAEAEEQIPGGMLLTGYGLGVLKGSLTDDEALAALAGCSDRDPWICEDPDNNCTSGGEGSTHCGTSCPLGECETDCDEDHFACCNMFACSCVCCGEEPS